MPRRKFIDKRTATTFALVHRAQNDPLINDQDASPMVFAQTSGPATSTDEAGQDDATSSNASQSSYRSQKVKQRGALDEEFGFQIRANEGEAAQHGVFFDDTEYDYMQHMRDLGSGEGAVTWVDATPQGGKKGKGKQKLEDALRDMDLDEQFADARSATGDSVASSSSRSLLPEDVLPSEFVMKKTYQDMQDVPDAIAGFQPDMDPRLREVLEALDDEAYVNEEDDVFAQLAQGGEEIDEDEFERLGEQMLPEEDDDYDGAGWESDDTIKASSPPPQPATLTLPPADEVAAPPADPQAPLPADPTEGAWLKEMQKFKAEVKAAKPPTPAHAPSLLESSALSSLASGRTKKRKGAKTSTTNYSMTSSALARTDAQTLLDARFDKIEEAYGADEEEGIFDDAQSMASGMSGMSKMSGLSKASGMSRSSAISSYSRASDAEAPQLERADFGSIMDEFLGGYSKTPSGRRVKRGKQMSGMEQLDEVRKGLGPARLKKTSGDSVLLRS